MLAIARCRFLLESIDFIVREIIAMMLAKYHLIKRGVDIHYFATY